MADKMNKWIPTSEMLPEEEDGYLVMWRRRDEKYPGRLFYEVCEYDPDEDEWETIEQAGAEGAEIVAWMPLPEPYVPTKKTCTSCDNFGRDCGTCEVNEDD